MRSRAGFSWLTFILIIGSIPATPAIASEKAFSIAFQGPLTGVEAFVGESQLDGVQFTVNEFNKRFIGKFKVSVVQVDDQGDPAVAQKIAPAIAANTNILGIVGPSYSAATIASLAFYKAGNLGMISPSAVRISLTDPSSGAVGFPVFHRVAVTDKVQVPSLFN